MADDIQLAVWVDKPIKDALDFIKDTKGIMLQHQVRFALLSWLESQGVSVKAAPAREDAP